MRTKSRNSVAQYLKILTVPKFGVQFQYSFQYVHIITSLAVMNDGREATNLKKNE